jgi:rfaE bifunctional protein kinase chain/domain
MIADEFIYGRVARVSREAPVLILEYDSTEIVPGGAGNAANNVSALGGRALAAGVVGRDEAGRRLVTSLLPGVEKSRLVRLRDYRTPVKTRILAGGIHSAKQQVVRIDRTATPPVAPDVRDAFERQVVDAVASCDAVLLSDYGLGLVTPTLASRISAAARRPAGRSIPVLVDSRHGLLGYAGLTACTPNEAEVEQLLGVRIGDDPEILERAGRALLKRTRMQAVLVTRGSRGMALFEPSRPTLQIPIFGSDQIADVTGAGDTVIATMSVALAAGAAFAEAAALANVAGGLVVMKRGTATVSAGELRDAIGREP